MPGDRKCLWIISPVGFSPHYVITIIWNSRVLSISPQKSTLYFSVHWLHSQNVNFSGFLCSAFLPNLKGHELCHKPDMLHSLALSALEKADSWKVHIFSSCPEITSLYTCSHVVIQTHPVFFLSSYLSWRVPTKKETVGLPHDGHAWSLHGELHHGTAQREKMNKNTFITAKRNHTYKRTSCHHVMYFSYI